MKILKTIIFYRLSSLARCKLNLQHNTGQKVKLRFDDYLISFHIHWALTNQEKIQISYKDYEKLIGYISESFKKSEQGQLIPIITKANYGNNDAFYEGVGSYSLFHTCNSWANNGLKACGQKASLWTPFDKGIFYHYQSQ